MDDDERPAFARIDDAPIGSPDRSPARPGAKDYVPHLGRLSARYRYDEDAAVALKPQRLTVRRDKRTCTASGAIHGMSSRSIQSSGQQRAGRTLHGVHEQT